ncbi:hypothetical protein SNE26_09430 [Mucilaginibacter sp. cycad4]|uniref:hypothetical protein n=1 Tax=Mucilaginibacter sp. cycad4 TaxID=3342096 RepID=UPI002AAA72A4|nr:hypothetical protein [Mucilaginibacter gossypii]WPV01995.1 hypothetical protein SNE26_09430 [Mucilaginibacter gossypii]
MYYLNLNLKKLYLPLLLLGLTSCKKMMSPEQYQTASVKSRSLISQSVQSLETVSVDFGSQGDSIAYHASGLLLGFMPSSSPPDVYIKPIKAQFHRLSATNAILRKARNAQFKMKVIVVLSEGWGYSSTTWPGGTSGSDWAKYQKYLHDKVVSIFNAGIKEDSVHFDIWNEPNTPQFWNPAGGSLSSPSHAAVDSNRKRFCQTFLFAVGYLKRLSDTLHKKITVEGPSMTDIAYKYSWETSGPDYPALKQLIDSLKAHNLKPDFLTWHFPGTGGTTPSAQIAAVKALYGTGVPPVIINEYIDNSSPSFEANPGRVGWLASQLERSGIEGAVHAVFSTDNELDNMVFKDAAMTWYTRGEWWWWKKYGNMTGKKVATSPSTNIDLIATADRDSSLAKIVLGNKGQLTGGITVHLNHVSSSHAMEGQQVFVIVEHIPYASNGAVSKTDTVASCTGNFTVINDQLDINFEWLDPKDSYAITLGSKGTSKTFELDSLAETHTAGRTVHVNNDPLAVNGKLSILDATAVGDFVKYTTPTVLSPGTYFVTVHAKKYMPRGKFQLSTSAYGSTYSSTVGDTVDLYDTSAKYLDFNLGYWKVNSSSKKEFTFKVTGKNSGSVGTYPYTLVLDNLKVTPVRP